ncbi:MAG: hypothetical protein JRD89_08035 [Deltaproteobacteria bacterium]|nr:hypothetical protein [Deltaproteobacteria bacterium]
MGKAYAIERPTVEHVSDVIAIRGAPDMRLTQTPFGTPPGMDTVYPSGAVAWKGKTGKRGAKGTDIPELPSKVKSGLAKAISLSERCKGIKGTAVDPETGFEVPRKVLCQRDPAAFGR